MSMDGLRPPTRRAQPWLALALGLGYLVTWMEILEQHYYRARFSWWQMYLPVILTPLAILAALLRATSGAGFVRLLFKQANSLMVTAGLLGIFFHWTGNFRKYQEQSRQGKLPGMGQSEDEQHAQPEPDVELAGYNLGQLLEVGSRGRPWLAPL